MTDTGSVTLAKEVSKVEVLVRSQMENLTWPTWLYKQPHPQSSSKGWKDDRYLQKYEERKEPHGSQGKSPILRQKLVGKWKVAEMG